MFADFSGFSVFSVKSGATASLINSTFANNILHSSEHVGGTAVTVPASVVVAKTSLDGFYGDTFVRLERCALHH